MGAFPFSSLPNLITLGRLILVPMIISAISDGRWTLTFSGFLLAGISDAVDGFLARRFGWKSQLGAYLDPVADKALLVSIYIALALANVVPSRDVMIVGGVIICWLMDNPLEIRPLLISKLNTTAQIAFAAAVLGGKAFSVSFGLWFDASLVLVAVLTLASAAVYLRQWLAHVTD